MKTEHYSEEKIVKELITRYLSRKPSHIALKTDFYDKQSTIALEGDNLSETAEYPFSIPFSLYARGVLDAYKNEFGKLDVVPVSYREERYRNEKVSLDLYPTGSRCIFDIYIQYK